MTYAAGPDGAGPLEIAAVSGKRYVSAALFSLSARRGHLCRQTHPAERNGACQLVIEKKILRPRAGLRVRSGGSPEERPGLIEQGKPSEKRWSRVMPHEQQLAKPEWSEERTQAYPASVLH
ncbi:hypothetical protein MC885_000879 [Smutsia gigantea]|nr:hypothetical protein MC885_000879 [Smutsia gigantea]